MWIEIIPKNFLSYKKKYFVLLYSLTKVSTKLCQGTN